MFYIAENPTPRSIAAALRRQRLALNLPQKEVAARYAHAVGLRMDVTFSSPKGA